MGANDIQLASRAVMCRDADDDRYEARLSALMRAKFLTRRDKIAADDQQALAEAENDMLDYFASTGALRSLIRTVFTNPSDVSGRELLRLVKVMMYADAEVQAINELEKPSRRPLGDCTRAALNAANAALASLAK